MEPERIGAREVVIGNGFGKVLPELAFLRSLQEASRHFSASGLAIE